MKRTLMRNGFIVVWEYSTYTFEIGGKAKKKNQISGLPNAFIIADEWDYKVGNKIPIWLLGLLY